MCYTITVKQKTQRLFDEFSYSFNIFVFFLFFSFVSFQGHSKVEMLSNDFETIQKYTY